MSSDDTKRRRTSSKAARAMTTQALQAMKEREDQKRRTREMKSQGDKQRVLLVILGVMLLIAGVSWGVQAGDTQAEERAGYERGEKAAAAHIAKKHYVLHVVEGDKTGVDDHGEAWIRQMRQDYKVYITVHKADASLREGWVDYCKGYNATMIDHLRLEHGADFIERAVKKAGS